MKNSSYIVILFLFIILVFTSYAISDTRGLKVINDLSHNSGKLGAYRALIIGINDYKDPKIPDLETAVNDAKAMAELLIERYGFTVKLVLDQEATKKNIYQALRDLTSSTKSDESVLIYYAGHGDLDRTFNDGWWIPVDAKGGDPVTYLDNTQVQKAMRSMQARHVLLISDSCYSGSLFGDVRAMPPIIDDKYYLDLYNEKSRWGMTSGNKTPVSDQGTGGHSIFAYQLIKELRKNEKPYISTQEIYTRIAPIVSNNSEQTPLCRPIRNTGDQGGEFVFVSSRSIDVERWNQWQQVREHEYLLVKKIDEDDNLTSEQKADAWQRFFAAVSLENPYSQQDDEMRSYSRSRMDYWKRLPPVPRPDKPSNLNGSGEKEIASDGTLIAYDSGVVFDKNTGLEWFAGPDRDTTWNDAKSWVESLNVAGGGWRMPTEEELRTLYKYGAGKRNMTPLLKTTGWLVWTGDAGNSSLAYTLSFLNGDDYRPSPSTSHQQARGFAVRSRR